MTCHYAVIGHPISHSLSPFIHAQFARQTGEDIDYIAKEIPLDGLTSALQQLQQAGFKGTNITVPFKEQAWQLVTTKSNRSASAGAINTIAFNPNGSLYGDNTDGVGLCRDLVNNHHVVLKNKRLLLLGAGGAARGVIHALLAYQPFELIIANRTVSKAMHLATLFAGSGTISGTDYHQLKGTFDVIINATSASLAGQVPPLPDSVNIKNSYCYDMMYSHTDTAFINWAKQRRVNKAIDGLGMLVEQAAEAFLLWRDVKPDTKKVIKLIKAEPSY